jgi:hypothetical protein
VQVEFELHLAISAPPAAVPAIHRTIYPRCAGRAGQTC